MIGAAVLPNGGLLDAVAVCGTQFGSAKHALAGVWFVENNSQDRFLFSPSRTKVRFGRKAGLLHAPQPPSLTFTGPVEFGFAMKETSKQIFEHAAAMPAGTWHFLDANDVRIEVPTGLAIAPDVQVGGLGAARPATDAFECALAAAQARWEGEHPAPTAAELAERAELLAGEADATYGGTAQSAYQAQADAIEEARSLALAFEHGMGDEVAAYLRYAAGERIVLEAGPGQDAAAELVVSAGPGAISVAAVDVVAGAGSTVRLSVVVEGEPAHGGTACGEAARTEAPCRPGASREGAASPACAAGIAGTTVRVFADAGAQVKIERMQTLPDEVADIDDMGLFAAADARIAVRQTVLGSGSAFTGLAGDLRGDASRIDVDTRYLARADQKRDFNYALRHHGAKSRCSLQANGVLAGKGAKTLRGTIDFVRGCKGAEGSEKETVLLVGEDARNKTVPVILCNEDDVAGNHGATIGHIREEQLFYLASRGLSREAAERMFVGALIEQAALDAGTPTVRAAAERLAGHL